MNNFINLGETSEIYPEIIYTPTQISQSEPRGAETEKPTLDWAKDALKGHTSSTVTVKDADPEEDSTSTEDTKSKLSYWDAWKDDIKDEDKTDDDKTVDIRVKDPEDYSSLKGFGTFKKAYEKAGGDPRKFNFFAYLAKRESGFNPYIQNKAGAPAYGYFQFMQGTSGSRSWNNVAKYAGVDLETFRRNPEIQIKAAHKLEQAFLSQFTKEDIKRARELGYSDSALVAGAWLGGVGGVRKFLHQNINVDDKKWSKTGAGVTMKQCMDNGNNYY